MKKQRSIAVINDMSGFGRCSLTVSLPILSSMKVQCGVIPTAILSNHTAYPDYTLHDFTPYMEEYINMWEKMNFHFDGLYTGFLGSKEQIAIIKNFIVTSDFTDIIVDPVMGDDGEIYDSYTPEMCEAMKELVSHSTLTTPNVTELCILTDTPYRKHFSEAEIEEMCIKLHKNGAKQIVVTGFEQDGQLGNIVYEDGEFHVFYSHKILPLRPGTGDVFSSIMAGCTLHNIHVFDGVKIAATFIEKCLIRSAEMDIPINDGVCFEEYLETLLPSLRQHLKQTTPDIM
jgi:pyridoxine kinase